MTKAQHEILRDYGAGALDGTYSIVGVEYPYLPPHHRLRDGVCLKISSMRRDHAKGVNMRSIDVFDEEGRTIDTQDWVA